MMKEFDFLFDFSTLKSPLYPYYLPQNEKYCHSFCEIGLVILSTYGIYSYTVHVRVQYSTGSTLLVHARVRCL